MEERLAKRNLGDAKAVDKSKKSKKVNKTRRRNQERNKEKLRVETSHFPSRSNVRLV